MRVVIIGAGISGLYLAWKLAERGEEVSVFEKKSKIGKEICSGLFSERILQLIPESKNLIKNQIDYCLIHFPKKTLKVKFSGKFFIINHSDLDKLVASLAEEAGAKIFLNHQISSLPDGFDRIIGCDGAMSQTRKNLKLKEPKYRLGIQGFFPQKDDSNAIETWPTDSGFCWKIPRGENIEYGIMDDPKICKASFDNFLKDKNISIEKMESALIPDDLTIPSNSSVALCGDAAGLTKPWSGGGVIWSLLACQILLKNFPDFIKYANGVKKAFLPKVVIGKIAKKVVYFTGFNIPWILPKEFKIESDFLLNH